MVTSQNGGLSSLQVLMQKLEQDRRRGQQQCSISASESRATPRTPSVPPSIPGIVASAPSSNVVLGGAGSKAAGLRASSVGRQSLLDTATLSCSEMLGPVVQLSPEEVVFSPMQPVPPAAPASHDRLRPGRARQAALAAATEQTAARADLGSAGGRSVLAGGSASNPTRKASHDLDVLGFQSDKGNFINILRFIKNKAAWAPPATPEERALLRTEALYFGCMALVQHLDALEDETGGGGADLSSPGSIASVLLSA